MCLAEDQQPGRPTVHCSPKNSVKLKINPGRSAQPVRGWGKGAELSDWFGSGTGRNAVLSEVN